MIVYRNRYVKKHVIGGSGILDTLKNILRRAATSSASRAASILASRIAKTELGREAIMATKSAGKELASAAISTAKDVAIDKGRKTIEKLYAKTGTPKPDTRLSQELLAEPINQRWITANNTHQPLMNMPCLEVLLEYKTW